MTTNADERGGFDQLDGLEHEPPCRRLRCRARRAVYGVPRRLHPLLSGESQTFSIDEKDILSRLRQRNPVLLRDVRGQ